MAFMLQDVIEELERSHSLLKSYKKENLVKVAAHHAEREEWRLASKEAQRAHKAAEAETPRACDAEKALQVAQFAEA